VSEPVLTLVHGNRLEVLADRLVARLGEVPPPPLVPEVVIVQSTGMARWLSLRLARSLGIVANVRFRLPAAFLWDTFRMLLPGVPASSPLEPRVAVWHLRAILGQLEDGPSDLFTPLHDYLRGADERGRHELAARIADLFDQYLVYRPQWITCWETGEGDHWQAALWRRLVARTGEPHRARVQAAALRALATSTPPGALPARVALFGIPTMPPAELEAFRRLADHTDVHIFRLSPSRHYWDPPRTQQAAMAPEPGHPLLASLGRQGRDFLDLLLRTRAPEREEEAYVEPGDDSVLHAIQTDLLTLRERHGRMPVAADDRSLQVHVCHGPVREVEVLHDQLHWLFEHHPDLTPADVVVMTPDIDAYAPCIEAVFGGAQGARRIPFTVADRSLRAESPLVESFLGLLDLRGSRYEADRLLALLDTPAVHRRFGLAAGDLELAQRLVRESAVRWGVDAAMRERLGLPAAPEHTWRFGLDRLLLGFALPSGDRRLREGVLPCDAVEGSDAQVLGRLVTFVDTAAALEETLAAPRSMAAWAVTLTEVLTRFIAPDEDEARAVHAVRATLLDLADDATRAGHGAPVPLELVRVLLRRELERPAPRGRFLAGGVTFCAMVPMRSIPFEVVCLIGMNDGSFPRARQPPSFDLMAAGAPEPGDRSRRDDDRYLFLEAVASARRCFYVSYVGRGIRDNMPIPPSVVVSELLDTVARGFDARDVVTVHPLQAFSPRYFSGTDSPWLVSYSAELCEASRRRGHGQGTGRPVTRLVEARLPDAPPDAYALDLARFLDFFANPTAYLLRERLGVRLAEAAQPVERREPFALDGLAAYAVRTELLARRSAGTVSRTAPSEPPKRDELLRELRARGLMPLGQVGAVELGRQEAVVEEFAQRLAAVTTGERPETLRFEPLAIGRLRLAGELRDVARDGVIAYRIADPKARDELQLWIRHLLLHVLRPRADGWRSTWLGRKNAVVFAAVDDAGARLAALADVFAEGLHRLLPLFPRTSLAWCKAPRRKLEHARRAWEGDDFLDGENADPYLAYAWRDVDPLDAEFERIAAQVMGPLAEHRSEEKA
jgi:exodeoxyribonuclease V gamma subunit